MSNIKILGLTPRSSNSSIFGIWPGVYISVMVVLLLLMASGPHWRSFHIKVSSPVVRHMETTQRSRKAQLCGWRSRVVLAFYVFNTLMRPVLGPHGEAWPDSGLEMGRNSMGAGRTSEKEGQMFGGRSKEAWETGLTSLEGVLMPGWGSALGPWGLLVALGRGPASQ